MDKRPFTVILQLFTEHRKLSLWNLWSLQDYLVYEFNQYLPKLYSKSDFDIGLDHQLERFNNEELDHRARLSEYACNDCLSLEIIIRRLKTAQFQFNIGQSTRDRSKPKKEPQILLDDSESDSEIYLSQLNPIPMVDRSTDEQRTKQPTIEKQQIEQQPIKQQTKKPLINRQAFEQLNPLNNTPTNRTISSSNKSSNNRTILLSNEQRQEPNQSPKNRTQTGLTKEEKRRSTIEDARKNNE